jgi:hypothetical protein
LCETSVVCPVTTSRMKIAMVDPVWPGTRFVDADSNTT